ncbi:MAG: cytochrome P450 [Pirellulaceae bacterium]
MAANKLPPGPSSGLLGLRHLSRMGSDYFGHLLDIEREFGDSAYYRVGPVGVFQFSHPDAMHEVLVAKAKAFRKPLRFVQVFSRWNGQGLVVSDGELWKRQRRLVQQAFHPRCLRMHDALIVREARRLAEEVAGEKDVEVGRHFARLTLRVVAEALFGAEVEDVLGPFAEAVQTLQETSMSDFGAPLLTPLWWPTAARRRMREAIRLVDQVVTGFVSRRRASGEQRDDLLSILLSAIDDEGDGGGMTDRQARDECVGLLLGGNETTAVALTWTAYLLARHPEWQQQVRDEIDRVVGRREATYDDLEHLPTVEMTLKEAMRLYPPAYVTTRETLEPVEIAGYPIPQGAQVHLGIYLAHRDPRWWSDPREFRPPRFADGEPVHRGAYLPFGAGPRACIGRNMAMMEGALVLTTLLQHLQLSLADDQHEPELEAQISLHPKHGVRLNLQPRRAVASA